MYDDAIYFRQRRRYAAFAADAADICRFHAPRSLRHYATTPPDIPERYLHASRHTIDTLSRQRMMLRAICQAMLYDIRLLLWPLAQAYGIAFYATLFTSVAAAHIG